MTLHLPEQLSGFLAASLLFGALGYFAGQVGRWLKRSENTAPWLDRIAGAVFVALGVKLMVGL